MPAYTVDGVAPEDEARVRSLIADMGATALPNRIVFVPSKQYAKLQTQIENGRFGGRSVGAGAGSEERYGANHTILGNGFSLIGPGQTYLNADLLKKPNNLRDILAHELGHYHAASMGGNASEATADRQKVIFVQRANQAQKIASGVQALPTNAQAVLSGAMRGMEASPQPPQAILAGKR